MGSEAQGHDLLGDHEGGGLPHRARREVACMSAIHMHGQSRSTWLTNISARKWNLWDTLRFPRNLVYGTVLLSILYM